VVRFLVWAIRAPPGRGRHVTLFTFLLHATALEKCHVSLTFQTNVRPVTPEVAGSSPVAPAKEFKHLPHCTDRESPNFERSSDFSSRSVLSDASTSHGSRLVGRLYLSDIYGALDFVAEIELASLAETCMSSAFPAMASTAAARRRSCRGCGLRSDQRTASTKRGGGRLLIDGPVGRSGVDLRQTRRQFEKKSCFGTQPSSEARESEQSSGPSRYPVLRSMVPLPL
jgi:hypothetical protein